MLTLLLAVDNEIVMDQGNKPDVDGYTPLHCAAHNGHIDVVTWIMRELLPRGVAIDINQTDKDGQVADS